MRLKKVVFFFVLSLSILTFYVYGVTNPSLLFIMTNVVILVGSALALSYRSETPFSLHNVFFLFCFFFYGIAPALEVSYGVTYWGGRDVSEYTYIYGNLIVITSMLIYEIFYFTLYGKQYRKQDKMVFSTNDYVSSAGRVEFYILCIFSLLSCGVIFWYNGFDVVSMLVRGGLDLSKIELSGPLSLVYNTALRPIPVICFVFYALRFGPKRKESIILLLLAIFFAFPTSMARYQVAVLYVPIMLVMFKWYRKDFVFPASILFSLLFVLPFLDSFRRFDAEKGIIFEVDFGFVFSGHFDSYQNFLRVLEEDLTTFGQQLIGVLLFFVPRSVWENKPISSGHLLSEEVGLYYSRIALNFLGEGYINFGIFGVFLFISIASIACGYVDRMYWKPSAKLSPYKIIGAFYPFLLGSFFFILRGSMLSAVAYFIGIMSSVVFIHHLLKCSPRV